MRFANQYGAGEVDNLPGCTQVAVNHSFFIYPKYRGKGIGSKNHEARLKRLAEMGYDYVICTVNTKNSAQVKILVKHGWSKLSMFTSSKTENSVAVYGRHIFRDKK